MLSRDHCLGQLGDTEFDVLIVGGGSFGAAAAWDASLRGLKVALIERTDFAAGVSANSFRIVHGGIRYLQHSDLKRLWASCAERSALLRIAPHLVQPLPILVPTYGSGRDGKAFLGAGMLVYDALTPRRNRGIADRSRHIPLTRFMARDEALAHFPDLPGEGLTGGAVFADGQMYNPTRLVLAFVQSAVASGAIACNYVEARQFLRRGDRIVGVRACDTRAGVDMDVRARTVVNAAGPWARHLLEASDMNPPGARVTYSRDTCFVVPGRFDTHYGVALRGRTRDPDAVLSRSTRHLFLVPWRQFSLVGVWHKVTDAPADTVSLPRAELEQFIEEVNGAYPGLDLTPSHIRMANYGLVPFGENAPDAVDLSYGKRSPLIDHAREESIDGLVTLIGVRYTMARGDAANALDLVERKLGRTPRRPPTHREPLHGGTIPDFESLVTRIRSDARNLPPAAARALAHNHGTAYTDVLRHAAARPELDSTLAGTDVPAAAVVSAIHDEAAVTLEDIVFRRTDLGTAGHPGADALQQCARIAGETFGWNDARVRDELAQVEQRFPTFTD